MRWLLIFAIAASLWGADLVTHEVHINDHPFALFEKRPEKPIGSVLLIHGRTWSSLPNFDLQVPGENISLMDLLAKDGYAVYALDMRGYGQTKRDASGWLSPDKAAADIAGALDWISKHSGLKSKPVLLGWSMGSTVSQLCAQKHPNKLSALILYGYWYNPANQLPKAPDGDLKREKTTPKKAAEDFIVPGAISKKALATYVDAAVKADPVRTDWRMYHQFNALDASQLTMPVMLIHGVKDPLVKMEAHAAVFQALAAENKRWVVMPESAHAASLERPEEFAAAVSDFIK